MGQAGRWAVAGLLAASAAAACAETGPSGSARSSRPVAALPPTSTSMSPVVDAGPTVPSDLLTVRPDRLDVDLRPIAVTNGPEEHTGPVRVLVAGDSTAVDLADEVARYAAEHPDELSAVSAAFHGCGLTARSEVVVHHWSGQVGAGEGGWIDLSGCSQQWASIPDRIRAEGIDVVLVSVGPWDGTDIKFADGYVFSVLDPVGRDVVADVYRSFVESVVEAGARPVLVTPADVDIAWSTVADPLDDPARWERLRGIIDELGVQQVDLPGWLAAHGWSGPEGRPDGVHLAAEVRVAFVHELLIEELVDPAD